MPTYTYLNTKTQEIEDHVMSISAMVQFEADNPHMQRQYDSMNIVDPAAIGVQKPPADFMKHVIGKVKHVAGADGAKLEKRWHIPKEV